MSQNRVPGAVFLVAREGTVVWEGAYGWAQLKDYGSGQYPGGSGPAPLAKPVPMTPRTVFDLASVTKVAATTSALMVLVDRGAVELDVPVVRYLPDFRGDGRETITVRHLLTHTSGLPQWLPVYYHASDPDEAWRYLRTVPLGWPVGAARHYSDLGFMVLGRLVEQVSGQALDRFVREHVFGPLGMRWTGFRPEGWSEPPPDGFAATSHGNPFEYRMVHDPDFGYRIDGDPEAWSGWRRYTLVGEVNDGNAHHAFGGVAGHAGLFSTARDLNRLLQLLLNGGRAAGTRIVAEETVRTFLSEVLPGQALGWRLHAEAPPGTFFHTGFTGTFVLGVPSQAMAVVLLTNRQNLGVGPDTRYVDVTPLQDGVVQALLGGG